MLIKVTQEDIDLGEKLNCNECPVARAMSRAFDCKISTSSCYYRKEDKIKIHNIHNLPVIVQNFIEKFDTALNIEPFEFEVGDEL